MKNPLRLIFNRVMIYGSAIVIKLLILLALIVSLQTKHVWIYQVSIVLSALVVLWIINNRSNPGYKIAWIVPIMVFPLFGGIFYILFGGNKLPKRALKRMAEIQDKMDLVMPLNKDTLKKIKEENLSAHNMSKYITDYADCPPFEHTQVEYYKLGEDMWESLKNELRKAEHYIFLEFFIVEEGKMWGEIYEILKAKVKEGVDVRFIWDDFGSILLLPKGFKKDLEENGIKCGLFNPLRPMLSIRMNNRDHRKIAVIDGHTGFVGGINLADEYINVKSRFGHWKDTAVMLKGEAVWSLTVMFLTMWDNILEEKGSYDKYKPHVHLKTAVETDGYVQPFTDNPLDGESVGETVYLNLISKAERYVYITTPYLIVDNEMITALSNAAKSGVDVRIITPSKADKWYVHAVTRAHYNILIDNGVKVYEYTPGFIHAKSFVVDDKYGVVGTINMDYRSLYLHFECGVFMYKCKCLASLKEDIAKTIKISKEITLEDIKKIKWWQKFGRAILRAFAPLM